MTDFPPESLPEWSDEELALWKSARDDRPPSRSLARTLQAVGVGGAITTAASGAGAALSAAKAGVGMTLVKWGAVVGLASAVAVGGGAISRHSNAPRAAAHADEAAPTAAVTEPALNSEPATLEPEGAPAQPVPTSTARLSTAARASSATASQPDIADEIKIIDTARALLRQGRSKEALVELERGKNKSLVVEATVLRIEALFREGDRARASQLASSFLSAHPKSPYAPRIRALMQNSAPLSPATGKDAGHP
jgi:hypothetical protein